MSQDGMSGPALSLFYAFSVSDQVLSQSIGRRHSLHPRETFRTEAPNVTHLVGRPVVSSSEPAHHKTAVELALRAQKKWVSLDEVQVAARAYQRAYQRVRTETQEVWSNLERLSLALGFPQGSRCDACRDWVIVDGTDNP